MRSDPDILHRKSTHLKDHDYSQAGGYFITIVSHLRQNVFGEIQSEKMVLNDAGLMVQAVWQDLPNRFPNCGIDIFQVMPNHFHGILIIHEPPVGAGLVPAHSNRATTRVAPTLGNIVGALKSISTHLYIHGVDEFGWPVFNKRLWQRNYYEHFIRDQDDYERIAGYIIDNPVNWNQDEENLKFSPK